MYSVSCRIFSGKRQADTVHRRNARSGPEGENTMLVKFHSSSSGEILMFAEAARPILEALGKERTARGVIMQNELEAVIARLEEVLARWRGERRGEADSGDKGDDAAPQVSLAQRAVPFLELLQRTRADDGYVMWDAAADF
jgi:hypothetical protein